MSFEGKIALVTGASLLSGVLLLKHWLRAARR